MTARVFGTRAGSDMIPYWTYNLKGLPGDEELLSSDGYHGLTAKDMLISSVEGWKAGGHMQNWTMPADTPLVTGEPPGEMERHYTNGVREPGFINMLVCADWQTTMNVIQEIVDSYKRENHVRKSDFFPCG